MHLLVSRYSNRIDYTPWFEGCPLTIACSNGSVDMIKMLLEVGYCTNYDINRALLEAVQYESNPTNSHAHDDAENLCEIINLLIEAGANPHEPVAITQFPDMNLMSSQSMLRHLKEKKICSYTPLMAAVCSEDVCGAKTMLNAYSLALPSIQSSRRLDPLLRTQPESYFVTLEAREADAIESSLQVRWRMDQGLLFM